MPRKRPRHGTTPVLGGPCPFKFVLGRAYAELKFRVVGQPTGLGPNGKLYPLIISIADANGH